MPADAPLTITELDALVAGDHVPDETLAHLSRRTLSTLRHLLIVHDYLETRVGLLAQRVHDIEGANGTVPVREGQDTFSS